MLDESNDFFNVSEISSSQMNQIKESSNDQSSEVIKIQQGDTSESSPNNKNEIIKNFSQNRKLTIK